MIDYPNLSRRRRLTIFLLLFAAFSLVSLGNALHKGGDFRALLIAGQRFLDAAPLYEGSGPGIGVTWPPFQAVAFAPFAFLDGISDVATRVVWYLLNLACVIAGVWCWTHAIFPQRFRTFAEVFSSPDVLLPLAAIVLPLQTNFEHQNLNALLLWLCGAGVLALVRGARTTPGAFLGAATALKAFPALLIAMLLARKAWRAAITGITATIALSTLIVVRYGLRGTVASFRDWIAINSHGDWPPRIQNQSLYAMFTREVPGWAATAHLASWCVMIGILSVVAWRCRRLATAAIAGRLFALTLAVAVVLSPVGWEHYWVLMFPILQSLRVKWTRHNSLRNAVFCISAVLISGPSPILVGEAGYDFARGASSSTIAALLLIATMSAHLIAEPSPEQI